MWWTPIPVLASSTVMETIKPLLLDYMICHKIICIRIHLIVHWFYSTYPEQCILVALANHNPAWIPLTFSVYSPDQYRTPQRQSTLTWGCLFIITGKRNKSPKFPDSKSKNGPRAGVQFHSILLGRQDHHVHPSRLFLISTAPSNFTWLMCSYMGIT